MLAQFRVSKAVPGELDLVMGILDEATRWLMEKGIPTVWRPGAFSKETFLDQIFRGEVYIASVGDEPAGTFILQWNDDFWWRERPPDAGYVHKVAVRPAFTGKGVGVEMLRWAENAARTAGKKYLRLNCMAEDPKIRDYYERAGFTHVGDVMGPKALASLYEKLL